MDVCVCVCICVRPEITANCTRHSINVTRSCTVFGSQNCILGVTHYNTTAVICFCGIGQLLSTSVSPFPFSHGAKFSIWNEQRVLESVKNVRLYRMLNGNGIFFVSARVLDLDGLFGVTLAYCVCVCVCFRS